MTEGPDKQIKEMQERSKEVERDIDQTEKNWETTQNEVPSADDDDAMKPLDEDNPVGGP